MARIAKLKHGQGNLAAQGEVGGRFMVAERPCLESLDTVGVADSQLAHQGP